MERRLIKKMIRNCFVQYQHDLESIPLNEEDYEKMAEEIKSRVAIDPESDVYEAINDVVYEYLSRW